MFSAVFRFGICSSFRLSSGCRPLSSAAPALPCPALPLRGKALYNEPASSSGHLMETSPATAVK